VPFGLANALHRRVGKGEVHLEGRGTRIVWRKSEFAKQSLGDAVVPVVFDKSTLALRSEPGLPAVSSDQSQLLKRSEVSQRGRGTNFDGGGNDLQGNPSLRALASADGAENVDLTAGQPPKGFHGSAYEVEVYIPYPNY
jgi:hypothetical protein